MRFQVVTLALAGLCVSSQAFAEIPGISSTSFRLTARADRITTPDGGSIYIWGFSDPRSNDGRTQYPGPTLKVQQGTAVTITVANQLPEEFHQRVSLALGGISGVVATCFIAPCIQGPITLEAGFGGAVRYTFTASRPGTFLYNSASRPDLQVEMGLAGAMIVLPSVPGQAYGDTLPPVAQRAGNPAGSQYDHEYLFFLSEMDSELHDIVEEQGVEAADASGRLAYYFPNYWFINGRNAPDTMAEAGVSRLPTQPYSALTRTHPGERVLMRVVGGGHDLHPFHHHGQHARIIAVDGFPLQTAPGAHFDLSHEVFTIQSLPGQTIDAILRWTGKGLGWDIYGALSAHAGALAGSCGGGAGHTPLDAEGLDPITHEYCADHGKAFPVVLPEALALANGPFYSGSPFLGQVGLMPPGDGGLNPNAGYSFMWHSHSEKEITNFDVFPGGMMTMLIVEPPGTVIP
jgi:FtsP/CotA-like multicopper oxidase with cupredoxin domain